MRRTNGPRQAFFALGVLVVVHLLSSCAAAAEQPRSIEPLGRFTVGSKLSEVRNLRQSENCLIEGNNADCTFIDANGVAYVVLDDSVIAVTASQKTSKSTVALPFGLKLGDSVQAAVQKLASEGKTWILAEDPGGEKGAVLSSRERYMGKNGWDFNVEILFEKDRLIEISYNSGTI